MKRTSVNPFRFFGMIVWTAAGIFVGGLAGAQIFARWLAPVRQFPPPNDATLPMMIICALAGSVLGVILAQISAVLILSRVFPVPEKTGGSVDAC